MKDLLLVLHSSETTAGTTIECCESRNISYEAVDASVNIQGMRQSEFRGVIVFGGDMEAWQTEKHPWLLREKALLSEFIKNAKPVFGICLGAQLVAEQLGSKISDMGFWEFGWFPVTLEADQNLVPMQAHSSKFTLPPGARRTATDSEDTNQGFASGRNIRGYQFHTEIDGERMEQVLSGFSGSSGPRVQNAESVREGFRDHHLALKRWYFEQLDSWWR